MNGKSSLDSLENASFHDSLRLLTWNIEQSVRAFSGRIAAISPSNDSHLKNGAAPDLSNLDTETQRLRNEIISYTQKLNTLVVGPRDSLKNFAWDSVSYIPLQAIVELKIAEAVPRYDMITYQDLAQEIERVSGVTVPYLDLRRLLRLAMMHNLFREPKPNFVTHSTSSLMLLDDAGLASWVELFTTDFLRPISNTVPAMRKWPGSQEPNETGINIVEGNSMPFFSFIQSDPIRAKRYDLAMKSHSDRDGFDLSHTVKGYPWAALGAARVVDLGGNQGYVSMALAEAFPSLSFIVQDKPELRTETTIGKVPDHLAHRIQLTAHDCFNPQPEVADVYFFRHVFHAFSDKYAVAVLKALVPAMRPGARVVVNDYVLPVPRTLSYTEEKVVRTMDMLMKTVCNARERELEDWQALFQQADSRFKWKGGWKSSGKLWFLEVVWEE